MRFFHVFNRNDFFCNICAPRFYGAFLLLHQHFISQNITINKMRKKVLLLPILALLLAGCASRVPQEKDMKAYLMVYHKDETHGLYMAISPDGYSFTDINNGNPVMAGDTIALQRGIRDPHIYRGPDGAFYLTMTDLHIYAQRDGYRETQFERPFEEFGWGNNRALVLMKSRDLINWTRANVRIDELSPELTGIGSAWAPETIYDDKAGKLMIYFSMRFGADTTNMHYVYVNDDFNRIESLPVQFFSATRPNAIDGDITKFNGKYYMFYASGGIKRVVSDRINGGYSVEPEVYDSEEAACEAPNVWKRIGEDKWVLMYDIYGLKPAPTFGFRETSDFENFTDLGRFNSGVMKAMNFERPKHGAVVHLTKKEAERLCKYWGLDMTFDIL